MSERIVVTGANRGLGLELVRSYRERGDEVWAGCRRPDEATELRKLTDHVVALDLADAASIEQFALAVGDGPLDVLVNNGGVDARAFGVPDDQRDVLQLDGEHFLEEMRINALGPLLLVRALLGSLRRASGARIVNLSSQVGSMVVGATMGRDIGYTASKAALNMVSVKLAGRLRDDGIVTISMHPGFMRTDMGGPGADLDPADAARTITATIAALTLADTGAFLRWDGTVHPW